LEADTVFFKVGSSSHVLYFAALSPDTGALHCTVIIELQVYDGAVYLHKGESYVVKDLDLVKKIAFLKKEDVNYFTQTRDHTSVSILGIRKYQTLSLHKDPVHAPLPLKWGPVIVSKKVIY